MKEETLIFIPINIMEEAVESVAQNFSGISGLGGTDSEASQGWLMEFGKESTRLRTSVETFVELLTNGGLHWADYFEFMSGRLIALDKHPGIRPVGIGEKVVASFCQYHT